MFLTATRRRDHGIQPTFIYCNMEIVCKIDTYSQLLFLDVGLQHPNDDAYLDGFLASPTATPTAELFRILNKYVSVKHIMSSQQNNDSKKTI